MLLKSFLRWFSKPNIPRPIPIDEPMAVLYARTIPRQTPSSQAPSRQMGGSVVEVRKDAVVSASVQSRQKRDSIDKTASVPNPIHGSHRQRLLSMRLEHVQLCNRNRCRRLAKLGIHTAGDLAIADPERLAAHFTASRKALRVLQQYRRAIRFAASVPGLMPRDAMLLVSIHRRSARALASESAAQLHRDLLRFSESSQGQVQLRGRRLPSTRRIKRWIEQCEQLASGFPMRNQVA